MRLIHVTSAATTALLLGSFSALLGGCAAGQLARKSQLSTIPSDAAPVVPPAPPVPLVTAPLAVAEVDPPPAALPTPPAGAGETLDDEKILEVAHVANAGEIEQAKLAQQRATDPRVRQLAQAIVVDSMKADQRNSRLAKERNLNPSESLTSSRLKDDAQQAYESLSEKTGRAFDVAYLDTQLDAQQSVLRLLDQKLIPESTDTYVKALVRGIRPDLAKRLAETRSLQSKMKE